MSTILPLVLVTIFIPLTIGTYRYYSNIFPYGTGDTMLTAFHGHGGTRLPNRKWDVECLDGEAMVGIHDFADDFEKLQMVWCKFTFPNKPPAQGLYPYYPSCHYRDFGILKQFFCYVPQNHSRTVNTFMTAVADSEYQFWLYRPGGSPGSAVLFFNGDDVQPYKCCKTPTGYYIDYMSCYYQSTHDINFEYYDSVSHIIVYCVNGFVMTGIAKGVNPWTTETHADYIQCCRVGFGPQISVPPPVITFSPHSPRPAYVSVQPGSTPYVPPAYQQQYRSEMSRNRSPVNRTKRNTDEEDSDFNDHYSFRFAGKGVPRALRGAAGHPNVLGGIGQHVLSK